MWTLVFAFALNGFVQQYQIDGFESLAACEYYAQEILAEDLSGVDNEEYSWICV